MNEILKKISSYNIFNYLLPGVLFAVLSDEILGTKLIHDNLLIGLFLYYFFGMVISRIGSLVVEPILKKTKIVTFSKYSDFVIASKNDNKIELFSEINNTYRTLIALIFLLIFLIGYQELENRISFLKEYRIILLLLSFLLIFLFSYIKQTKYINKRIKVSKDEYN